MTTRWILAIAVCSVAMGCGRLGFEPLGDDLSDGSVAADGAALSDGSQTQLDGSSAPDAAVSTDLQLIDNRPTSIELRVDGRFSLVFDAAHRWQVSEWRDLASDSNTNLVNDGKSLHTDVLQAPLRLEYGPDELTLDNAYAPSVRLEAANPQMVELKTEWLWDTSDGKTIEGEATHLVRSDGNWSVEGELKYKDGNLLIDRVYYAQSNLDLSLGWDVQGTTDEAAYFCARAGMMNPRTQLQVRQMDDGALDGVTDSSPHWITDGVTATVNGWTTRWNNRIWPSAP